MSVAVTDIEAWLDRLYVAAEGARLRAEDRKKARELVGLLDEVDRAVRACGARRDGAPLTLVDAAAGKAYVGLLAAPLVLAPLARAAEIVLLEREPGRVEAARAAAAQVIVPGVRFEARCGDVADPSLWPPAPDVVVALHACGEASDHVIARATAANARHILLAPCCIADAIPAAGRALARADALGVPRHAAVRRRFVQAMVDAERTLRLEAAGYETVVAPFAPPTVTPHGLVWRARRVGEPGRMREAAERLARLEAAT
jgi:hypothetical protein